MFDQQKYYNLQYNYKLHYFYGYSLKQKYFSSNDILSIFNLNKISCFKFVYEYSQTYIQKSCLGQREGGLIRQVGPLKRCPIQMKFSKKKVTF
jgi:hypothetical protein